MAKMSKKPVTIIGAGPAGLTAGYYLTKYCWPVTIVEADKQVGGLSKTINYKGYRFDIGGHRFLTKMDQIFKLWVEIVGKKNFIRVNRLSRIYYQNQFFSYPLQPFEALRKLGIAQAIKIVFSYFWIKLCPKMPENDFETYMINRFGKNLYKLFFKKYTQKILGIDTKRLSADWASQRIKGLSLIKAVTSTMQSKRINKKVKSLTRVFHYPRLGPGQMWEAASKKIVKKGGIIKTNRSIIKIKWNNKKIKKLNNFSVEGQVLSSMPIVNLVNALNPPPPNKIIQAAKSLKYRDFITVVLIVERKNIFPDNWIYVHDTRLKLGRIQNYKNWSKKMVKNPETTSSLGLEYFCNEGDQLWNMTKDQLIDLGKKEIAKMDFIKTDEIIDSAIVRAKKAYPVYDLNYKKNVKKIRNWLEKNIKNLTLIGRNGMHRYNNQDHSMLTGLLAAKNIALKAKNDIWQVDPDALET